MHRPMDRYLILFGALLALAAALHATVAAASDAMPDAGTTGDTSPDTMVHAPAGNVPQTVTRSGHEFLARCSNEAFARARFPQKLAARCTRLMAIWRAEASGRGNGTADTAQVTPFGAPRGIPLTPPPTPAR